jgi:hypothetical protein
MTASISIKIDARFKAVYLDEATKTAVVEWVSPTMNTIRKPLDDIQYQRLKRSGEWSIRHADGSTTPARRKSGAHDGGSNRPAG